MENVEITLEQFSDDVLAAAYSIRNEDYALPPELRGTFHGLLSIYTPEKALEAATGVPARVTAQQIADELQRRGEVR